MACGQSQAAAVVLPGCAAGYVAYYARANWLGNCLNAACQTFAYPLSPCHSCSLPLSPFAVLVFIFIFCPVPGTLTGTCIQPLWQPFKSEVSFRFACHAPSLTVPLFDYFPSPLRIAFHFHNIFPFSWYPAQPFFASWRLPFFLVSRVVHTPFATSTL